ncbi:MAG TPA: DUF5317 family protein, partial [Acidimicrobiales bacterium]|nr:DUF5317 family protein [Acidimicrobiales bacterium]
MAYAIIAVLLGAGIGLATGGRLRHLGEHRLAAWPLLAGGIFIQAASQLTSGTAGITLLLASYACLAGFAAINMKVPWMVLVAVGLGLNILTIAVNGGMPVRPSAVIDAGITDTAGLPRFTLSTKHHFERRDDRLMVISDIIPVR